MWMQPGRRGQRQWLCLYTTPTNRAKTDATIRSLFCLELGERKLRGWGGEFGKRSIKGKKLQRHSRRLLPPTPRSQSLRRKRSEGEHNDAENREIHCVRGLAALQPCRFTHTLLRVVWWTSHVTPEALYPSCLLGCCGCYGRRLLGRHRREGRGRNL